MRKGSKYSEKHKKRLSEIRKGYKHSEETKRKISKKLKGRKLSFIVPKGSKSPHWKGGIVPAIERIRSSSKMKQWRQAVYIRDSFTCQSCGDNSGGNLRAHHKKSFAKLLKEAQEYLPLLDLYSATMIYIPLWDIHNGKTLCKNCHKKTKNFGKNFKGM